MPTACAAWRAGLKRIAAIAAMSVLVWSHTQTAPCGSGVHVSLATLFGSWIHILTPFLHLLQSIYRTPVKWNGLTIFHKGILGFTSLSIITPCIASVVCPTQTGCNIGEVKANVSTGILDS